MNKGQNINLHNPPNLSRGNVRAFEQSTVWLGVASFVFFLIQLLFSFHFLSLFFHVSIDFFFFFFFFSFRQVS